jgi:hypothetical protein
MAMQPSVALWCDLPLPEASAAFWVSASQALAVLTDHLGRDIGGGA